MTVEKCPGQDRRFWKPDDVYEVPCENCGQTIEFFKDDPRRRCSGCGTLNLNPKILSGCAKWCAFAKECLGFDPHEGDAEESVCDRLILEMKKVFGADQKRITHALKVLNYADDLLKKEGNASPVVVKAAAVLHDIGIKRAEERYGSAAGRHQETEGPPIARAILEDCGLSEDVIEHVCRIIANHHSARDIDTPEFRIIWDADWLVNFADEYPEAAGDRARELIDRIFKTASGKARAEALFLESPAA